MGVWMTQEEREYYFGKKKQEEKIEIRTSSTPLPLDEED